MRLRLSLTLIMCVQNIFASAQQNRDSGPRPQEKVIISFFEALSHNDSTALVKTCSPDILILEHGIVWNKDSLIQIIRANQSVIYSRANTFDFIKTEVKGKTAWTTYYNEARISRNGLVVTKRWLESAVLILQDKRWTIKILHSTRLNNP